MTVRTLTLDDRAALIALRARVLRPGLPLTTAEYAEDDLPTTVHIGAFDANGTFVGCATLLHNRGLQLRGMAVAPESQGSGVGAKILRFAEQVAQAQGFHEIWCNARVTALGFYEKQGWLAEGDEFEVLTVGPHYVMRRYLNRLSS